MSRKNAREIALHLIFEQNFQQQEPEEAVAVRLDREIMQSISGEMALYAGKLDDNDIGYIKKVVNGIFMERPYLDAEIQKYATGWNLSRLSRMTLSILRLALYEMREVADVPEGAAINEAVELAKTYESAEAGSFINGILGSYVRGQQPESSSNDA